MKKIYKMVSVYFIAAFLSAALLMLISSVTKFNAPRFGLVLPQFGPLIGYLTVKLIFRDRGIKLRIGWSNSLIIPIITTIVMPFIIVFIMGLTMYKGEVIPIAFSIVTLGGILLGSIGEEIGWRGFMQPELEKLHTPFTSAVIVGFFFGIWHVPRYFLGARFMVAFVFMTIALSLLMAYYSRNNNRIIVPVVFHTAFNYAGLYLASDTVNISIVYFSFIIVWSAILVVIKREYFFRMKPSHEPIGTRKRSA